MCQEVQDQMAGKKQALAAKLAELHAENDGLRKRFQVHVNAV